MGALESSVAAGESGPVRALVLAAKALRERGGSLTLVRPRRAVARVLELMGVTELLVVQGAAEEAERPS